MAEQMKRVTIANHTGDFFDMLPDTWIRSFVRGRESAILCCPQCGQRCSLDKHTIADNGDVSPIVRCETLGMHHEDSNTESSGCDSEGFHEHITLEGWGDRPCARP